MVPEIRRRYNKEFTTEKYKAYLQSMDDLHPGELEFRVAETPLFVTKDFIAKALAACESIVDVIVQPQYKEQAARAIPAEAYVPNEDAQPHCIAFDFGICSNDAGDLEPQLIEMQGFPSLFAYQVFLPEMHAKHFYQPDGYSSYLEGFTRESYVELLRSVIVGDSDPENVILLEIFPKQQKTRVDFWCTEDLLGIKTVCLTELEQDGKNLYYDLNGKRTRVDRIYNRLIFDDLFQQPKEVQEKGKILQQELDVKWIPHPNWFYRLSKFTLPFIDHPYVPHTRFLDEVGELPHDLENYVVKPLFSFAGQGVIIDVTPEQVRGIPDPHNWILQKKVQYAPVIDTPGEAAKAEIRLFYFWEKGTPRPVATTNLARLSKGKMVGVRYNQDKDWVGGTFCLFEQ